LRYQNGWKPKERKRELEDAKTSYEDERKNIPPQKSTQPRGAVSEQLNIRKDERDVRSKPKAVGHTLRPEVSHGNERRLHSKPEAKGKQCQQWQPFPSVRLHNRQNNEDRSDDLAKAEVPPYVHYQKNVERAGKWNKNRNQHNEPLQRPAEERGLQ
jgi:hypothetical protein